MTTPACDVHFVVFSVADLGFVSDLFCTCLPHKAIVYLFACLPLPILVTLAAIVIAIVISQQAHTHRCVACCVTEDKL